MKFAAIILAAITGVALIIFCSIMSSKNGAIGLEEEVGHVTNSHSKNWNVLDKCGKGRQGTAQHAERRLLARYGELVKTIVICRIGRSGELRPINPCKTCLKAAAKYGAKIISVLPGQDDEEEQ